MEILKMLITLLISYYVKFYYKKLPFEILLYPQIKKYIKIYLPPLQIYIYKFLIKMSNYLYFCNNLSLK